MKRRREVLRRLMRRRAELENRKRRRTGAPSIAAPAIARMYQRRRESAGPDVFVGLRGLFGN